MINNNILLNNIILIINLFLFLFPLFIITSPTIPNNLNNLLKEKEEKEEKQKLIFWKIIERSKNISDLIILKKEFCKKPCNEIIGKEGYSEQLNNNNNNNNCICYCPINEPIFINNKEEGKCSFKINDCIGHSLKFEQNLTKLLSPQSSQYVPIFNLLNNNEEEEKPLNLNINWKENGIKIRSRGGPKCLIKTIYFLGNNSKWNEISKKLFKLAEWEEEKNNNNFNNGNILWIGNNKEIKELSGGIIRIELECSTKRGVNDNFCLTFRIEGKIEFKDEEKLEKIIIGNENIGMEVEKGRRVEVIIIILLSIFLFLSLFGFIILWNVCWRVQKRKLVHSLQMQFFHYARQEKEKAISECQLRYQALVKAVAGIRSENNNINNLINNNNGQQQSSSSSLILTSPQKGNNKSSFSSSLDEYYSSSSSSSCEYSSGNNENNNNNINNLNKNEEQQNGTKRKLYFSSGMFN